MDRRLAAAALVVVAVGVVLTLDRPNEFVVVSVGDINLAENVTKRLEKHGGDVMFEHVREHLAGDFLMGNLESVVTDNLAPDLYEDKPSIHEMEPKYLPVLRDEGFGLLTIANNHTMDQGPLGLSDMLEHLDAMGLGRAGAGMTQDEARRAFIIEGPGIKIGVLAFAWPNKWLTGWGWYAKGDKPGVYKYAPRTFASDVRKLKEQTDFIIASVHWGNYYRNETSGMRRNVQELVDAGVDLVNGHGAHVSGGVEFVDGVPVLYDLGNFTFGSWGNYERRSPDDRTSVIARYVFEGKLLTRIELLPILTDNRIVKFKTRPVELERAQREFEPDLDRYGVRWRRRGDGWYVVSLPIKGGCR